MARLAVAVAGGIVGAALGFPGLGFMIGSIIGGILLAPQMDLQGVDSPRLTDLRATSSAYGQPIIDVYGTTRVHGSIIWSTGIRETIVHHSQRVSKTKTVHWTEYLYDASIALALCRGPISNVQRIWADGKLIWSAKGDLKETEVSFEYRLYKGDEYQQPDSAIIDDVGEDNAPAYRGLAYLVLENFQLEHFRNQIPNFNVELARNTPNDLSFRKIQGMDELDIPKWDEATGKQLRLYFDNRGFNSRTGIYCIAFGAVWGGEFSGTQPHVGGIITSDIDQMRVIKHTPLDEWVLNNPSARRLVWFADDGRPATTFYDVQPLTGGLIYLRTSYGSAFIDAYTHKVIPGKKLGYNPLFTRSGNGCAGNPNLLNYEEWYFVSQYEQQIFVDRIRYDDIFDSTDTVRRTIDLAEVFPDIGELTDPAAYGVSLRGVKVGVYYFEPEDVLIILGVVDVLGYLYPLWNVSFMIKYDFKNNEVLNRSVHQMGEHNAFGTSSFHSGKYRYYSGTAAFTPLRSGRVLFHVEYRASNNSTIPDHIWYMDVSSWTEHTIEVSQEFHDEWFDIEVGKDYTFNPYYWFGLYGDLKEITYNGRILCLERQLFLHDVNFGDNRVSYWSGGSASSELSSVVREICVTAGIPEGLVDTSELHAYVEGFMIGRNTTPRAILDKLAQAYFFEAVETDGILKFRHYGNSSILTIPEDDLIPEGENYNSLVETPRSALELPIEVRVQYLDREGDYQYGNQHARRVAFGNVASANAASNLEIPAALTPDRARQIAERHLYTAWAQRVRYKTQLPWRYLPYDVSDVVTFAMNDGRDVQARLAKTVVGADFKIEVGALSEDEETYTSTIKGARSDGVLNRYVDRPSIIIPFVINTPLLRDQDATTFQKSLHYLAAGSISGSFNGVVVSTLPDARGPAAVTGTITRPLTYGAILEDISHHRPIWHTEFEREVTVTLLGASGELSSVSHEAFLAGSNAALIGNTDRWEVVQFRDAELIGDAVYRLRVFLRGRRGTEWAIPTHAENDWFILLEPSTLEPQQVDTDLRGGTLVYAFARAGQHFENSEIRNFEFKANDLRPYAPADIRGVENPDGSVTFTWQRRTRLGGGWKDGTGEVPLNETITKYELFILSSDFTELAEEDILLNGEHLRHVSDISENSWTYTAGDRSADGNDVTTEIFVVIYQWSEAAGRGFPGWARLTF